MLNLIKKMVPNSLRQQYFKLRTGGYGHVHSDGFPVLLRKMNKYFSAHPEQKKIYEQELSFLNNKESDFSSTEIMAYPFVLNYDYREVEVLRDEEAGMFYVMLEGKRLYFHKGYATVEDVQKSFTYSAIEQDIKSPHRYLDENFCPKEGDIVADLGAAEGNFSLMVVDKVKELYLFETQEIWREALEKTFEPWKDKVHIINKFVGSRNEGNTITLDSIFSGKDLSMIKMDIEGAEIAVLESSRELLRKNNVRMAITTYHRQTDAADIRNILEELGYTTSFTEGFMLFIYDSLEPPYFRKGILKAYK